MTGSGKAVILGTRGSIPVAGKMYAHYGQETTSLLVCLCGEKVLLDAGTGLSRLERHLPQADEMTLILTHCHLDHLLGFPMWSRLLDEKFRLRVLGRTRHGLSVEQQVEKLMSPPLWPVRPRELPADIQFCDLLAVQRLGELTVSSMEGVHPGGVSLVRLDGDGKSVVFMTDCIVQSPSRQKFLDFAKDCDFLLIDGQYSPEEWETHRDFGHSTWLQAAEFGRDCGAGRIRITHHDPTHTDELLDRAQDALTAVHPDCRFARAGEEISL